MSLDQAQPRLSVLIVEDEWLIRADIAEYFLSAGWSVFEANNGDEALELLANGHSIDVVVTDIRLGGALTDWDVAEAFRKSKPQGRVVYTSGNVLTPRREVTHSVFIEKPYQLGEVLSAARG